MNESNWHARMLRCHICGVMRSDDLLGVVSRPFKVGATLGMQNVRHCIDKPDCVEQARTYVLPNMREAALPSPYGDMHWPRFLDEPSVVDRDIAFPMRRMLPVHMWDCIEQYIGRGREQGHFWMSVVCGELFGAVQRADEVNRDELIHIVQSIVWYAPAGCWGSPEKVSAWIARGGLVGHPAATG